MSSFGKKMVKDVFSDEVFGFISVHFFFSIDCKCIQSGCVSVSGSE